MEFLFCFALFLIERKAGLLEEGCKVKQSHYWLFPMPSSTVHWISHQGLYILPPLLVQRKLSFYSSASLWVAKITVTITLSTCQSQSVTCYPGGYPRWFVRSRRWKKNFAEQGVVWVHFLFCKNKWQRSSFVYINVFIALESVTWTAPSVVAANSLTSQAAILYTTVSNLLKSSVRKHILLLFL